MSAKFDEYTNQTSPVCKCPMNMMFLYIFMSSHSIYLNILFVDCFSNV